MGNINRETRLYIFLFLVATLGGAIRKWLTESSIVSNGVLLIEMLLPFILFIGRGDKAVSPFKRQQLLVYYFFYLVFHIINPVQHTIFHGLLGFIIYGTFWIGIFYYINNRELFWPQRLMKLFFIISAIEIILAFVQYQLPTGHFLNKYAREMTGIATVGDRVRVSGTFSYLSGYTAFLLFYPFFVWALLRLRYSSWIVAFAIVFGMVAAFMTGSRSAVLLYMLFIIPIMFSEFTLATFQTFVWKLTLPLAIGITFMLVAKNNNIVEQISAAYGNFADRAENGQKSGEQRFRLIWDFYIFQNRQFTHPFTGIGLGSTYQGATILFGKSAENIAFGYVENEPVKVVLEGGVIIAIFKICLAGLLISRLSFKGPIKWVIWFVIVYAAPITFNMHNAVFLLMGIILADNIIWRQQVASQEKNEAPEGTQEVQVEPMQMTN